MLKVTSEVLKDGEYVFAQLNFHWGADNTKGSEHTLNGAG